MAPVIVAGTTLTEAVWLMDSLDCFEGNARAVSMGQVGIEGLRVGAVIVSPSLALAAHGVLGSAKRDRALGLIESLRRSLRIAGPGSRVRATSLHEHVKADAAFGEGFYSLPLMGVPSEPGFAPTHRTVETWFEDGDMDSPQSRKVVEHFERPRQSAPLVGGLVATSGGSVEASDVAAVAGRLHTLGVGRIGR